MTQESLRPLTDSELEVVAAGMIARFSYGDFKMQINADSGGYRVDYTNGNTCGWIESNGK